MAALIIFGGKSAPAAPPAASEEDAYTKASRLEHEAEPHITRLFQAKRAGDKPRVRNEFEQAREKLLSAMSLLEGLKVKYTDDNTLEGELPGGFTYLDSDLQRITEKHIQIIKEVEY